VQRYFTQRQWLLHCYWPRLVVQQADVLAAVFRVVYGLEDDMGQQEDRTTA
jgi:hypothetical protein